MRSILVVSLIVFLLILAILSSFLVLNTFDPDRLKPHLELYFSRLLKADVRIQRIVWPKDFRPSLKIERVFIRDTDSRLLLKASAATVSLKMGTFLSLAFGRSRNLQIESLIVEGPEIFLSRFESGRWNWRRGQLEARAGSEASLPEGLEMNIRLRQLLIKDAVLVYIDKSMQPVFQTRLEKLQLSTFIPANQTSFQISGEGKLSGITASEFRFSASVDPLLEKAPFQLSFQQNADVVGELSWRGEPQFKGKISIHQIDLESVWPEKWKQQEYLSGRMSATFEGLAEGTHPEQLKKTAALTGAVDIRNGAFQHMNFVHEVFLRISPVPGFSRALDGAFPPEMEKVLKGEDLHFSIFQASLQLLQGKLYFEEIRVKADHYALEAEGSAGVVPQDVDFRAQLVLMEALSAQLIQRSEEMVVMQAPNGRMVIPFGYRGLLPSASVFPDLQYISQLLVRYRAEVIAHMGMEKINELMEGKK